MEKGGWIYNYKVEIGNPFVITKENDYFNNESINNEFINLCD